MLDARGYFNRSEFTQKVLVKAKCLVFHGMEETSLINQIESLKYLDVYNSPIRDLKFLEKHLELGYLDIHQTNVSDLSSLSKLTKLEYLDIRGTKVMNLKPLAKLKNLRTLLLDTKTIFDISPLSNLDKVEIIRRSSVSRTTSDEDDNW